MPATRSLQDVKLNPPLNSNHSRNSLYVLIAIFTVAAATLGAFWLDYNKPADNIDSSGDIDIDDNGLISKHRPDFSLPGTDGLQYKISDWDGKVVVVNFWATWCQPCRREIPAFTRLQENYGRQGLQFVGIAIDDLQAIQAFTKELETRFNYPILQGNDQGIEVAIAYGDDSGILPYTVIINREGRIVFIQYGELSHDDAEHIIQGLL